MPHQFDAEEWNQSLQIPVESFETSRPFARRENTPMKLLIFCILLVLCWPVALAALFLYPIVWLILLPFRLVGIAVGGALELVAALITLPARVLRAI
jgi:hypothetical protein